MPALVLMLVVAATTRVGPGQAGRLHYDQLLRLARAGQTRQIQLIDPYWLDICAEPLRVDGCTPSGKRVNAPLMVWFEDAVAGSGRGLSRQAAGSSNRRTILGPSRAIFPAR